MIKRHQQQGLTIVELLVAMALGIVLVGGITQVYLENKRNYVQDEAMARLQENGRFAINLFKRELKMAGFFGIGTNFNTVTVPAVTEGCVAGNDWALNFTTALDFVNNSPATVPATTRGITLGDNCIESGRILPDTDILAIKRVADRETVINGEYNAGIDADEERKERWYLQVEIDPSIGGAIMSTDFVYVDDSGFAAGVVDPSSNMNMWLVQNRIFYVRDYSVDVGDGIPTLMMTSLANDKFQQQALVEGVEALHIEFGIPGPNSEGTPVQFISDPDADDLSNATVARVYMLLRSREPITGYTDTKTYRLGSLPEINPADKRFMRRVFTTTVGIRNRD